MREDRGRDAPGAPWELAMRRGLLLIGLGLGACTTPLTGMVNPATGQVRTCTSHLPPGLASLEIGRCIGKLKDAGFVEAEELTAEQRAGLEARAARRPAPPSASPSRDEGRSNDEAQAAADQAQQGMWRRVTLVPDAMTVILDGGQPLRYIGIKQVENARSPTALARAVEAVALNRQLVEGQTVRVEFDVRVHDPEGRLWAYVYLVDGRMVNALMVERGYAQADPYPPDLKYAGLLRQMEDEARAAGRGLWAAR